MSCCLVLRQNNTVLIGADTCISTKYNNELVRVKDKNVTKVFKINDKYVLYCSGAIDVSEKVKMYSLMLAAHNEFNEQKLSRFLQENVLNKNKKERIGDIVPFDVEILLCKICKDCVRIYQLSEYNNYAIKELNQGNPDGIELYAAGIKNKECTESAKKYISRGQEVRNVYINTFEELSCNYIGGNLDLYCITNSQISQLLSNYKLSEKGILYIDDLVKRTYAVNAGVVMGNLLLGNKLCVRNDSNTMTMDKNGLTVTNGINTFKVNPNDASLFQILKNSSKVIYMDSSGNSHFEGTVSSSHIIGGDANFGNGTTVISNDGKITTSNIEATNAVLSGKITSSEISGGTINGATLRGNEVYIKDKLYIYDSTEDINGNHGGDFEALKIVSEAWNSGNTSYHLYIGDENLEDVTIQTQLVVGAINGGDPITSRSTPNNLNWNDSSIWTIYGNFRTGGTYNLASVDYVQNYFARKSEIDSLERRISALESAISSQN